MSNVNEYLMGLAWRCTVTDRYSHSEHSRAVYLKRNTTLWTNTYNSDGIRVSRTSGESTYNYTYLNGQLTHLTVDGHTMYFYYGDNGTPMALSFNGVRYYYVTSLQGDVIAIVDQTGTVVTTYLYDAWGNHLHVTGSLSATVGRYNPLRYRGYVYDRETNLYYLQSRYYNPETGRFINADGFTTTGQGLIGNNMFAYCGNNPVNCVDPSGQLWDAILEYGKVVISSTGKKISDMWHLYAYCGSVAAVDGPLPLGDAVGLIGAGALTVGALGLAIYETVQFASGPTLKHEEREELITTIPQANEPVIFPHNPEDFRPVGLIKQYRTGTHNGAFINWISPITNTSIFRWDENCNKANGSHYHIIGDPIHYYPGNLVPEPYASTFFPQ